MLVIFEKRSASKLSIRLETRARTSRQMRSKILVQLISKDALDLDVREAKQQRYQELIFQPTMQQQEQLRGKDAR